MPIRVLIISDNKPGHLNQSLGLVESLKGVRDLEVEIIEISYRVRFLRSLLNRIVNSSERLGFLVNSMLVKYSQRVNIKPDLVVSCGGYTCASNILLARKFVAKNVFLGTPKGFDSFDFSLVISTSSIGQAENNLVVDVMPQRFGEAGIKKAASQFLSEKSLQRNQTYWVMLIGGPTDYYEYSAFDWEMLVSVLNALAQKYSIKWLVSTSRRTPDTVEKYLMSSSAANPNIAYSVLYNQKPEKCLSAFFGLGSTVFCTEDSTSMLSEAIMTSSQVISLRANTVGEVDRGHIELVKKLSNKGAITRLKFDDVLIEFNPVLPKLMVDQSVITEKVFEGIGL